MNTVRFLADEHPGGVGIGQHSKTILADSFTDWPVGAVEAPRAPWHAVGNNYGRDGGQVSIEETEFAFNGIRVRKTKVLRLSCWRPSEPCPDLDVFAATAGIEAHLGNYWPEESGLGEGYEEVYVRYYMRLSKNYRPVSTHGCNLGGRDVSSYADAVYLSRYVGMAECCNPADHGYFFSGLEPFGRQGGNLSLRFYSYHAGPKPGKWGHIKHNPVKRVLLEPGQWYCVERRLKLNSVEPVKADGLEQLWIDNELVVEQPARMFRKIPEMRITFLSLESFYKDQALPEDYTRDKPISLDFCHLVAAERRIGSLTISKR